MNSPAAVCSRDWDCEALLDELERARAFLLAAASELPTERWAEQPTANYSPVGWHLGHCATVEARWLLGENPADTSGGFFDPALTPKGERSLLPRSEQLLALLAETNERTTRSIRLGRIPRLPGLPATFLVHHLAQHQLQHAEHVRVISALLEGRLHRPGFAKSPEPAPAVRPRLERLEHPGGLLQLGCDDEAEAYDNECRRHPEKLAPFWMDALAVTVGQFEEFIAAGGYRDRRLWTPEGFEFVQREQITAPLGFVDGRHPDGAAAARHPVTCVSWYEADAYARFRSARLPREEEWEAACRGRRFPLGESEPPPSVANVDGARRGTTPVGAFGHGDLCGNAWEWTSSWFEPYPGFRAYPYDGYSAPWFQGTHRVLRGGSWATKGRICRSTFRNWYSPGFREMPAGFRCAGGLR